ncbi:MAG: NACHT domain-containing protein [Bacteroidota bacterium]|nr:NACHT domain-containing protein [Bacteroidota bacterium]
MDSSFLYLNTPSCSKIDPPINTTGDDLPIEKLIWEDFEKLCLRISAEYHSIDDCEIYGVKGQKQNGIDIFAKKDNGNYSSYQCKRYQRITEADLTKAITKFKKEDWFSKSDEFIFCTTFSLNVTQLQNKFNALKAELNIYGITLIKWDKIQICRILKDHPQIVYDFFGREWVKRFNGEEKLNIITQKRKLDVHDVLKFREELYKFYSIVFNTHDSGIAITELKNKSFPLQDRFIMPDTFEDGDIKKFDLGSVEKLEKANIEYNRILIGSLPDNNRVNNISKELLNQHDDSIGNLTKNRINIDSILTKNKKSVILGDPGSGKSTLLRNLVLDILSSTPKSSSIAQNWGKYLPIWLPFAFITKNLSKNNNLSIPELLKIWFVSHDKGHLYDIIKDALEDERLLLVIDGIDELTNMSSAHLAISKIEMHTKLTETFSIYSGRPYGYRLLRDSFSKINELYLLPFSEIQQEQYIFYWYEKWLTSINTHGSDFAKTATSNFLRDLKKSPDLLKLAETPLLLGVLVTQKLRNSFLPNNKKEALEAITKYLIETHPRKRTESANITIENEKFNFDPIDIFEELAIYIQKNLSDGIIDKSTAKKVVEDYLVRLAGYKNVEAKKCSDEILDIGANSFGIIIEKTSNEIAFTHRQFQEFLAARYIFNSSDEEQEKFMSSFGGNPVWNQVIKLYFALIPTKRVKQFEDAIKIIGKTNKQKEFQQLISFLKYDIVLTLTNTPLELAKEYFDKIKTLFEFETNTDIKKIYWRIILESLYNSKIKEEVWSYLLCYFPNYYKYNDYRIAALKNITIENITQNQREFLLKGLINGNTYQKLDASYTINKFIKDEWLQSRVVELLKKTFNPKIIPFALNCLISDDVEYSLKVSIIEKFIHTEHPDIELFLIKLKVHLKLHSEEDFKYFTDLQKNKDHRFNEEVSGIFINGWSESTDLLNICLKSLEKNQYKKDLSFGRKNLNSQTAWKVMFHCFNKEEAVIDRIISELNNEEYPFNGLETHKGWPYILNYFKDNKKLIPIIDEWINKQKFVGPEIAYASLVGRTEITKRYLMKHLPEATFSHWITMALIEGWKDDEVVIKFLKDYFEGESKTKNYSAHHVNEVFKDEKQKGINILEPMIFNRGLNFRDRAMVGLIKLDKEYFKNNILEKFIIEEFPHILKDDFWGSYQSVAYLIVENFKDEDIVKKLAFQYINNNPQDIHLIIDQYPEEIEKIDNLLQPSQLIGIDYRLQLVEKCGEQALVNSDIQNYLSQFSKESEGVVKSKVAINYFNLLKHSDSEKIISICVNNVFFKGIDFEVQRQIAFCGYLITKRLPEYFSIQDGETKEFANPRLTFGPSHSEMNTSIINLLIDNFEYLNSEVKGDFKRLNEWQGNFNDQLYWSFWAKYSSVSSPTYSYIMNFLKENEDNVTEGDFLDFLNRTAPQSSILKNISLRLVKAKNYSGSTIAGQILGKNFNKDEKVFQELSNITNYVDEGHKIVALCLGWPDEPILKTIFDSVISLNHQNLIGESAAYHLKFRFRDLNNIMDFFNKVLENYKEAQFQHRYFISPLLRRINKDIELQTQLKSKLLSSTSPSIKISFYAVLDSINKIDKDILIWKNEQQELSENQSYGYNILTNELALLSSVLNEVVY